MEKQYKPKYVKKILVSKKETEKSIAKAAKWLDKKFANKKSNKLFVCILKGAIPFFGNLIMRLNFDFEIDSLRMSSYKGAMGRTTNPEMLTMLKTPIKGKDVVLVEDIIDTAKTMSVLVKNLKQYKPKSITVICLVNKPEARLVSFKPDYSCITLKGNPFLVGWGLDVKEKARNLPYIAEFDKRYFNKV